MPGHTCSSLFNCAASVVMKNLASYSKYQGEAINCLPNKIKNVLIRRICSSRTYTKALDYKLLLKQLVNAQLSHIDLSLYAVDDETLQLLEVCVNLEFLHIEEECDQEAKLSSKVIQRVVCRCPQLQDLKIFNCDAVDDAVLTSIATCCRNLRKLCLSRCRNLTDAGIFHTYGLVHLKGLDLSGTQITSGGLERLMKRARFMESINELRIRDCKNIDYNSYKYVVQHCRNIATCCFSNINANDMDEMPISQTKRFKQLYWTLECFLLPSTFASN